MTDEGQADSIVLATAMPRLMLRTLSPADALPYYRCVDLNREHLLQHGDNEFDHARSLAAVSAMLDEPHTNVRFGVWLDSELVGRVDLNPVDPPRWAIGYWLHRHHLGQGIMTTACRAAIDHGRRLDATEIYAGVSDGNDASINVLRRLGFEYIQHVGACTRWRYSLINDPPDPVMVST